MRNWHIVFSGICCATSVVIATSFTFYRALPAAISLSTPNAKVGQTLLADGNGGTSWTTILADPADVLSPSDNLVMPFTVEPTGCMEYVVAPDAIYIDWSCVNRDGYDTNPEVSRLLGALQHLPVKPMSERK